MHFVQLLVILVLALFPGKLFAIQASDVLMNVVDPASPSSTFPNSLRLQGAQFGGSTGIPSFNCRASAAAPTYTEGSIIPCSTDLAGNLRILGGGGGGGTSSTFGAAFPATGTAAGFKDILGNMSPGLLDASNNLRVTGTITANAGTNLNTSALLLDATLTGRFPTAVALSDALGNPTTTEIGANLLGWDATNTVWRRVQVDTGTGTVKVDPGTVVLGAGAATIGTVNQGTAAALSGKWPVQVTDGTNVLPTMDVASRKGFVQITDGTNVATVTAGGLLNVSSSAAPPADTVGTTGTLNVLNATAQVTLAGQAGVGMFLAAGTLIGTIVPELSNDGGTTWAATLFYDPATNVTASSIVFGSSNTATMRSILTGGGVSHVRVRVSAFTSGTASATLRGTGTWGGQAVTAYQGTSPWSANITQFGGNNIVTGTGAGGLGIPRVTVSNDSAVILGAGASTIGSLAANQSVNVAQVAGNVTATLAAGEQKVGVEGLAASGAAKSGNPVQIGSVFNTTQPTATTGQVIESQATARGGLIVATGTDVFNVTINAALPTGANVIGAVNQGAASSQSAAGWPTQPWGMTDTLFATGSAAAPAAGAAIATLTNPAAGTYRVGFSCGISVAAATAGDAPNMEFRIGATVQLNNVCGNAGSVASATLVGSTMGPGAYDNLRITLNGATSLSVNATGAAGGGNTYVAQIWATRIF